MSEKKKYYGKTTIRILEEKAPIYEEFKDLVMNRLHSDICYVTVSLWDAFNKGMAETPEPSNPVLMKFPHFDIFINMGNNFNYAPQRARRSPYGAPDPRFSPRIETEKNRFLPLVLDQWKDLAEKQRSQLLMKLVSEKIIPPEFLEWMEKQKTQDQIKSDCPSQSMAFDGKGSRSRKRSSQRSGSANKGASRARRKRRTVLQKFWRVMVTPL